MNLPPQVKLAKAYIELREARFKIRVLYETVALLSAIIIYFLLK